MEKINEIAKKLLTPDKGILAADESNGTADKRLASFDIEGGEENRRKYRELFLNTEGIEKYISGVILYDETMRQVGADDVTFPKHLSGLGIIPGIKVDTGAKDHSDFSREKITEGLEGLEDRLKEYYKMGARFTKWRAVVKIDEENNLPTEASILENAKRLAEYAKIVQENNMVPIIEPEVLLKGGHSIKKSEEVLEKTLQIVFDEIKKEDIDLSGLILKTSMVVPGDESGEAMDDKEVAKRTVRVLKNTVPENIGGVVFLSGGQNPQEARDNLNEIAKLEPLPFEIAFSFARAIQGPAMNIWRGKEENISAARKEFIKWLEFHTAADKGAL